MKKLNVARLHSIEARIDNLTAHGQKQLALAIFGRLQNAVSTIKPDCMTFSRPAVAVARQVKPARKLTDHKTPAVGQMDFSDRCYVMARRVVSGKIKRARRAGVIDSQNVYLTFYADFLHVAFMSIEASYNEGIRIASLTPSGYDFPDSEPWAIIESTVFAEAFQACGRFAYDIEKRAKEGTPLEHVSDSLKTSSFERKLASFDSVKTAREALEKMIIGMDITDKAKRGLLQHFRENRLTDIQRRELMKRAIACGILALDVTGNVYIND